MKKIKIGEKEYFQCETTGDLNAKRYIAFQNYILEDESGQPIPTLKTMFSKFKAEFDRESKAGMFITVHDYLKSLTNIIETHNPMQMAFALLVHTENEDLSSVDPTMLKEKVEMLCRDGLKQGMVEEVVTVFLNGLLER